MLSLVQEMAVPSARGGRRYGWPTAALLIIASSLQNSALAQRETSEDGWLRKHDPQMGISVFTKEMTLHPQRQPEPALKHRLIPDEFERSEGNAAIFYLKASGFLEQESARDRVREFLLETQKKAEKEGLGIGKVPPHVWLETPPHQLPIDDVKSYLQLTSFQPGFLREASLRTGFDLDRNFRSLDDPISYLLPEVQVLREVARLQSMRCRVAIAEGRLEDALEILRQQFSMAEHLAHDDFLVTNLVGIAIAGIAWNDALYFVQEKDAPNLYWALAALPRPLANLRHSMSFERQMLLQQIKTLREVSETPQPAGYWQVYIDRLVPQIGILNLELGLPALEGDDDEKRAAIVAFVAAAYPGARQYLLEELRLPAKQVDAYPTAQVVFLAMVRHHQHWRDEIFKWTHVPLWQARSKAEFNQVEDRMRSDSDRFGWFTVPAQVLLPAVLAVRNAEARCEQTLALLQTVEAVRMYAADHDGALPPSLDALAAPAPVEPFTGKPLDYEKTGDRAALNGHALPGMRYRLILKIAD